MLIVIVNDRNNKSLMERGNTITLAYCSNKSFLNKDALRSILKMYLYIQATSNLLENLVNLRCYVHMYQIYLIPAIEMANEK